MYNFEVELFACGKTFGQQIFFRCFAEDWNNAAELALKQFPDTNDVGYLVRGIHIMDDEYDPN